MQDNFRLQTFLSRGHQLIGTTPRTSSVCSQHPRSKGTIESSEVLWQEALILWQNGRSFTWDVTITDTVAQSYLPVTTASSGGSVDTAAERKTAKYIQLAQTYTFILIAVETLGPVTSVGLQFLSDLGRHITQVSSDRRKSAFLFLRLSVLIQRFNAELCCRWHFCPHTH